MVKNYLQGVKFYARKGLTGITGNIYSGLHEFNDMAFLLHFLREEDTFFDIGANAGSYTLLASGVRKSNSVAIEPVPSTFNLLQKNIGLNGLSGKVSLINCGAGSTPGTLSFSSDGDTTNHVIAAGETPGVNTIAVEIITIDSVKAQPALIKIDVEGFETEVLNGMAQTLRSSSLNAIIIELNGSGERYGFDDHKIHELLTGNGFNAYDYDPFKRSLSRLNAPGNFNTIYCRDMDFINNRIKSAAGIKIMGEVI